MKYLTQTIQAKNYKHFLLSLLFFSLPTGTIYATSIKQETYEIQKNNINDLDDRKEPDEQSIEGIDREKNNINDLDDQKEPGETSIEDTKEEKKIDQPSFDVEKMQYFIDTAIKEVGKYETKLQNNEMVYFYGNTGAGKSTIINYLLGNELEKYYPEDEKNLHTNKKHSNDQNNTNTQSIFSSLFSSFNFQEKKFKIRCKDSNAIGPKIGQNDVNAQTTYPCPYFPQGNDNNQLGYCDTAGFSDNRGIENIVCAYIGNNLIIQKSNNLKAICFVTYKSALETRRGAPFLDSIIETIANLFKKKEDGLESIFIVLNNKEQIDNKKLRDDAIQLLLSFGKGFEENKQKDQQNASKYENYINILFKIINDSKKTETTRILVINPLDDGTSRKNFVDRISKSKIIPKQNLQKLASKQGEEKVKYLQKEMLQQTEPILNRIIALTKTVNEKNDKASELDKKIQKLNKDKENLQKTINNLKNSSQDIQKEQQELGEKITNTQKDKEEIQKEIKNLELGKMIALNELSQYDSMKKKEEERISKIEKEQNEIKTEIKKLKKSIKVTNNEIDKLNPQIEKETKQIQQLNNEKNTLLENTIQNKIIALAKDDKNWFDNYKQWLESISDYWAETKLEQNVFDSLSKHICNALQACNRSFRTLRKHASRVTSIDFNRSGTLLASASSDKTVNIWDTRNWNCIETLQRHANWVNSVHFNSSDKLLASGSSDKTVNIWDTSNWRCIKTLKEHASVVNSVNFNPSGTLLASGSDDKTINIWGTSTWCCIKTLKGHTHEVYSVVFNPKGTWLASASWDKTIRIWDTSTLKCNNILQGHTHWVNSVHFNHNSSLLASASGNKTIRIWDTNTWRCTNTLQGHTWIVKSVHFNHNGSFLASASSDKTIRIWDTKNMLDNTQSNYRFIDKDKFKTQTDDHLKKINQVISHYYDTKTQDLTESNAQKEAKKFKDKITFLTKDLITQKDEKLALQRQIDEINSKIDKLDNQKLEKIEEQIKNNKINHEIQQKLANQIQKKKEVDSIIYKLQQSSSQKKETFNNLQQQLTQAQHKYDVLLQEISRKQGIHHNVSDDFMEKEKELAKYQGILQRKREGIDLILKIDKIVPMGLITYSFIKSTCNVKSIISICNGWLYIQSTQPVTRQ